MAPQAQYVFVACLSMCFRDTRQNACFLCVLWCVQQSQVWMHPETQKRINLKIWYFPNIGHFGWISASKLNFSMYEAAALIQYLSFSGSCLHLWTSAFWEPLFQEWFNMQISTFPEKVENVLHSFYNTLLDNKAAHHIEQQIVICRKGLIRCHTFSTSLTKNQICILELP